MKTLFEDGRKLIELCKAGKEDEVINAMLTDVEMNKFISYLVKGDKIAFDTLMHDTILSFIRSCLKEGFNISNSPIAYAKTIAKNNWLMIQRKKEIKTISIDDTTVFKELSSSYIIDHDKKAVVEALLSKVPEDCRQILYYWAMKYKMSEIAETLDINSAAYVKKKKHLCLKKLITAIENDPKYKEELKLYVR